MQVTRLAKIVITILVLSCLSACATDYDRGPNIDTNHLNVYSSLNESTVWNNITDDLDLLPSYPYPQPIHQQLQWYQTHPHYFDIITTNAGPYIQYIYEQTRKRHLPAELALLPMVESAYDPFLYSRAGAIGLWQMMPGTAAGFGLKINWWYDGRRDIIESTRAALDYLTYLHDYFDNDWLLAIAAYNSGEGTVQQAILHNKARGLPTDFWDLPLPPETRVYVPKLLALAMIIHHPGDYGYALPKIPAAPYFGTTEIEKQMDINTIAKLAEVQPYVVRVLNPQFRRPSVPPGQNATLVLPVNKIDIFEQNEDASPDQIGNVWVHHSVQRNETLLGIARKYKTTTDALVQANHLPSRIVHSGQDLLIPQGMKSTAAVNAENNQQLPQQFGIQQRSNINEDKIPGPQQFIHVVERGENLHSIARRYHVPASQIAFWNNLNADQPVHIGQSLSMWLSPRHYAALIAPPTTRYVVRRGDTISGIAERYHTTVTAIKQMNRLHSNMLQLNQVLQIPGHAAPVYKPTAKVASRAYIQAHQKAKYPEPKPRVSSERSEHIKHSALSRKPSKKTEHSAKAGKSHKPTKRKLTRPH